MSSSMRWATVRVIRAVVKVSAIYQRLTCAIALQINNQLMHKLNSIVETEMPAIIGNQTNAGHLA